MNRSFSAMLAVATASAIVASGCGQDRDATTQPPDREPQAADRPESKPTERSAGDGPPSIEPIRCPPDAGDCASASGEIVYVERIDPDGDGDAHFVLLSDESVTAPGISVIDVARDLRPHPLPQTGDTISAAGPVRPGSYGQRQIEAIALRVARSDG